jgi:hypothetical protein
VKLRRTNARKLANRLVRTGRATVSASTVRPALSAYCSVCAVSTLGKAPVLCVVFSRIEQCVDPFVK